MGPAGRSHATAVALAIPSAGPPYLMQLTKQHSLKLVREAGWDTIEYSHEDSDP